MNFISADTPLYNHPLPEIENWLRELGCEQDPENLNCWLIKRSNWEAEVCLEIEEIIVRYLGTMRGGGDLVRSFKYSLSRQDIQDAIFSGP